jgi:hypothetical protein
MEKSQKEVNIEKTALENIYAETVNASKVGVKIIHAGKANLEQAGIVYLNAQNVEQKNCGTAIVRTKNLKTDDLKSLVTIADNIEGNVHTVLDKKGAAIFGLLVGAVLVFFRMLRKLTR